MCLVRASIVTNFRARDLSSTGTSRQCSSCRPSFTSRRPNWTDSSTRMSLKVMSFLNVLNKYELDVVDWITRGQRRRYNWRNGNVGGSFSRKAFWWSVYWADLSGRKCQILETQSSGQGRRQHQIKIVFSYTWIIRFVSGDFDCLNFSRIQCRRWGWKRWRENGSIYGEPLWRTVARSSGLLPDFADGAKGSWERAVHSHFDEQICDALGTSAHIRCQ